jgi:hypothetical protein
MKKVVFIIVVCSLFFIACDPKINERAARYNPTECPICPSSGKCRTCQGTGECGFCSGSGIRTTSTKNYTGEGINLINYEEDCPFCRKTGVCYHCNGVKGEHGNFTVCFVSNGTGEVDTNWTFLIRINN